MFNVEKQKMLFNMTSFSHEDGLDAVSETTAYLHQVVVIYADYPHVLDIMGQLVGLPLDDAPDIVINSMDSCQVSYKTIFSR